MNANNPTEPNTAVTLYNVSGVPQSVYDGVVLSSGTIAQSNITTDAAVASPYTITMTHQVANGMITVQMKIKQTAASSGTFAAKIAIIEKTMTFTSPAAGTNGETTFLNVFKKYLPDANGTTLTTANIGDSMVITKSWTYANVQNIANLEAVGYIQNTSGNAVPQAAYSVAGTIPPTADFTTATSSSCTGQISFSDASTPATSWSWNFGDGQTSTLQNPTHTYTTNGTFNVSLTITANGLNGTTTKNNYVTINMPAAPVTTGGNGTVGYTVTLSATGSGTLNWYTASTGGTSIATGGTYVTPPLSTTTNYYVESDVTQSVQSIGMAAKGTTGGYYTSTARQGETFNALTSFTLKSVTVYANTTASRTIFLADNTGKVIDSLVTSITSGTQSVTLNFHVPAGTGYTLGCSSNNSLWRETAGPTYPYTVAGVASITGSTAGSAYYYYCYNWQIQADPCISPRSVVTADIATGIIEKGLQISYNLFPNPNAGEFTLNISSLQNQNVTVNVVDIKGKVVYSDVLNVNGDFNKKFDFKGFSKGVYFMRIITNNEVHNEKIIIE